MAYSTCPRCGVTVSEAGLCSNCAPPKEAPPPSKEPEPRPEPEPVGAEAPPPKEEDREPDVVVPAVGGEDTWNGEGGRPGPPVAADHQQDAPGSASPAPAPNPAPAPTPAGGPGQEWRQPEHETDRPAPEPTGDPSQKQPISPIPEERQAPGYGGEEPHHGMGYEGVTAAKYRYPDAQGGPEGPVMGEGAPVNAAPQEGDVPDQTNVPAAGGGPVVAGPQGEPVRDAPVGTAGTGPPPLDQPQKGAPPSQHRPQKGRRHRP